MLNVHARQREPGAPAPSGPAPKPAGGLAAPTNDLTTVLCCWDGFPLLATTKGIRVPTSFLLNLRCSFSDLKESGPPLPMFIMAMTPPVTSSCDAAGAEAFPC